MLSLCVCIRLYTCIVRPYAYVARLCLYATRFRLYAANDRDRIEIESGFLRFAISGTDRSRGPVRALYGFVRRSTDLSFDIFSIMTHISGATFLAILANNKEKTDVSLLSLLLIILYYMHIIIFACLDTLSFEMFLNVFTYFFMNLYFPYKCTIQKLKW